MPSAPVVSIAATSSRMPALTIIVMRVPSLVTGGRSRIAANSARRFWPSAILASNASSIDRARADDGRALAGIDQDHVAFADLAARIAHAAEHGNAHRTRHDHDMAGERAFLQDHALQPAPIIFEQFGRAEIARDQDRILAQAHLRGSAELARDDPQQPVGEILQIVHPVGEQGIVDLAHPHARALLDALDRRLGGQAAVDRGVDPARPAFVIGEHLVGREDVLMLARRAEFGLAHHAIDLIAHLVERRIDAVAFIFGVFGDGMLDHHARLVEDRVARRHAVDQLEPGQPRGAAVALLGSARRVASSIRPAPAISSASTIATVCSASISTSS